MRGEGEGTVRRFGGDGEGEGRRVVEIKGRGERGKKRLREER